MPLNLKSTGGGSVSLTPAATAVDVNITVPATAGTLVTTGNLNAAFVPYVPAGGVATDTQTALRRHVWLDDYVVNTTPGITDMTAAFALAAAAIANDGVIELIPGSSYRITDTVSLTSKHLYCKGKATIIADLANSAKDAVRLSSVTIRGGSAQDYKPAPKLDGVLLLVKSNLRDGIRLNGGDYPVWGNIDVQRDPSTLPTWRDGIHVEADGNETWTENIDWRSVRVHDAGRDGFRFEVPANAWTNTFINVGNYSNCEVRGSGLCEPGVPVHFVSRSTDANNKISWHNFIGGEYQTNNTATNPNPDGFKATKTGTAEIEGITLVGATAECVPTQGTGLGFNSNNMREVDSGIALINFGTFGFTGGDGRGWGGTAPIMPIGYLGLDGYQAHGEWTVSLSGSTVAGTPVVTYQKGIYSRVGKVVTVSFEIFISDWGGATGNILIGGLPFPIKNDVFATPTGVMSVVNSINYGAGYTQLGLRGAYNSDKMSITKNGSGLNFAQVLVSDATTPFQVSGSMTYYIN